MISERIQGLAKEDAPEARGERRDTMINSTFILSQNAPNVKGNEDNSSKEKDKMLRAALHYANELNWAVLPLHGIRNGICTCSKGKDCPSPGKHPLIQGGAHSATKTPEIIKKWWRRWPNANIGIAVGKKSGFFVLDIDGETGEETLADLELKNGPLPPTVEQLTGNGRHLLFQTRTGAKIGNAVGIAPGLDIRGDGGYIVAAPSQHISGREYGWEVEHDPNDLAPALAPAWLLSLIWAPSQKQNGQTDWETIIANIPKGKRNDTLARYTGRLLARDLEPTEALKIIIALNNTFCSPPLDDDEVFKVVNSICGAELRKLRGEKDAG